MFDILFLGIALIGSIIAGLWDLKTTEIPDEIPYAMIIIGILGHSIESYLIWNYWPILLSIIVGLSFLGFGFLMYYIGQWGGGDAKVLSGIGFLLPYLPSTFTQRSFFPFPLSFFFNVFFIGAIYMILYALILSIINRNIWSVLFRDLRGQSKLIVMFNTLAIPFLIFLGIVVTRIHQNIPLIGMIKFELMMLLGGMGFFFTWKFVKTVEGVEFKKRVIVSDLKEGDVLLDSRVWEGVTKKEIEKIKKTGKRYVFIKTGVRFAPAFVLALLFTLFAGDGITWLIGSL